jgi:hypothetical protein
MLNKLGGSISIQNSAFRIQHQAVGLAYSNRVMTAVEQVDRYSSPFDR